MCFRFRISLKWFLLASAATAAIAGTLGKHQYECWQHARRSAGLDRIQIALTEAKCPFVFRGGQFIEVQVTVPKALEWLKHESDLECVATHNCELTDADVHNLASHTKLRELRVLSRHLTNDSLRTISSMHQLVTLELSGQSINDSGLAQFGNLRKLKLLRLDGTSIQGRGLDVLRDLPNMTHLLLDSSPVTDDGLAGLANCKSLEFIDLSNTRVTGRGLAHLSKLPGLKTIRLHGVTLNNVEGLALLDQVEELDLYQARLEPGALRQLREMAALRNINLSASQLNDASLAELQDATQIESVNLWGTNVTDSGLPQLHGMKNLNFLNFGSGVTENGARTLSTHLPYARASFNGGLIEGKDWKDQTIYKTSNGVPIEARFTCQTIDRRAFARLGVGDCLERLTVRGTDFDDELARRITNLKCLKVLDAAHTKITDIGLIHFEGLANLAELNLKQTQVTKGGLARLSESLPNTLIIHTDGRIGPKWIPMTTE